MVISLLLMACTVSAQEADPAVQKWQAEMYKYFSTPDSVQFFQATRELKAASLKAGDEISFYKAWGNEAIYESTHDRRNRSMEIAKAMKAYAMQQKSKFGEYTSMHVMAIVCYYMLDYDGAERNFLKAIDMLHENFPGQSAAADYIELLKINEKRRNYEDAYRYGAWLWTNRTCRHSTNCAPYRCFVPSWRALAMHGVTSSTSCMLSARKCGP